MAGLEQGKMYATPDGRAWTAGYNVLYGVWELWAADGGGCLELRADGALDRIPEFAGTYIDDLREPTGWEVGALREVI